jgi:hypothetical protein
MEARPRAGLQTQTQTQTQRLSWVPRRLRCVVSVVLQPGIQSAVSRGRSATTRHRTTLPVRKETNDSVANGSACLSDGAAGNARPRAGPLTSNLPSKLTRSLAS